MERNGIECKRWCDMGALITFVKGHRGRSEPARPGERVTVVALSESARELLTARIPAEWGGFEGDTLVGVLDFISVAVGLEIAE